MLEQVVLDRRERERLDVPRRLLPIGRLARIEGRELDREALPICAGEQRLRCLGQLVEPGECVLELVVCQVAVGLAVVALGDEVEERLAGVVERQPLVDYLPAHRLPFEDRRERVPEPGAVGPVAAEATELLVAVRVNHAQPVASEPRERAGRSAVRSSS